MNYSQNTAVKFKPLYSRPTGIGGWLALFIGAEIILRPYLTISRYFSDDELKLSRIAERFPTTGTIFTVERLLVIHLIIFGIAIGLALWRVHTPFSVKLTKIYLIVNPICVILQILLYKLSDLPPAIQDKVVQYGFTQVTGLALWCLLWLLYFIKSERVKATYYEGSTLASNP
ncbi:MAG: hypothetical protein QOC96_751 [Acidobacteriota bacterium]|jgi:hypothetical protein|nr:hypothetical protein [Acidobacteriota bacterium]